jgi:hypothetical protein
MPRADLAARIRSLAHLSDEDAARELGVRPSYVRRVRARSDQRGRRAGAGREIRLTLPATVDARLRARALARGVTPAAALTALAAEALETA